jgi:hypothetical protein
MVGMNKDEKDVLDVRRLSYIRRGGQIDRMYYNIIIARGSITIRSSFNVRIV